jgi:hypothetical protein
MQPLAEGTRPFVHVVHDRSEGSEKILHHGQMTIDPECFRHAGVYPAQIAVQLPPDSPGGEYTLRFGLYNPTRGGARVVPAGPCDGSRVRGGRLLAEIADGKVTAGRYEPETAAEDAEINQAGRVLDFGRVATNGAFRLRTPPEGDWELLPLPGSLPFEARLRLPDLGARTAVTAVESVALDGTTVPAREWQEAAGVLSLRLPGDAFAYRLRFATP